MKFLFHRVQRAGAVFCGNLRPIWVKPSSRQFFKFWQVLTLQLLVVTFCPSWCSFLDFIYSRRFCLFYVFSVRRCFLTTFFTFRRFVPVDVFFIFFLMSQSAFFSFDIWLIRRFISTFYPSTFFTVGVCYFDVLSVK